VCRTGARVWDAARRPDRTTGNGDDARARAGERMRRAGLPCDDNEKRGRRMASEKSQNVQDVFLNHIRKHKVPVTVFLVNGVKLQGIVTWFDNFCVLLRRDAHSQLVYKHAISTVMPASPISLFEGQKEEAEA
jgi:host factor-I protein